VSVKQAVNETIHSELNRGTPKVTVYSNQGLAVRQLGYCRRVVGETAETRINLQRYNNAGQLTSSIDPRLSSSYLNNPSSGIPNQQQQNTLSGTVVKSDNVDAGIRVLISDVKGQPVWNWDSRGTERRFDYDELRRVTAVREKEHGKESICRERFRYGETSDAVSRNNRVGQLLEHLDTAGRRVMPAYSLLGQATSEELTFLKTDAAVSWTDDDTENAKLLEDHSYASRSAYNALGEILTQIDAANNARHTRYDIAGQVSQTTLQLSSEAEKALVDNRIYRATGQLQEETLGSGIKLHYDYESDTQRLKEKRATRLSDNKRLQSLRYTYDPVGNILSIEDKAQETEYYKNDQAESISQYVYDTLYQLVSTSGVESEQASCETSRLSHAVSFGNKDASRLVNYHRSYSYDAGGNLFEIKHRGANTCTQELTIDILSNRGIAKREAGPTLQESFDGNGNLLYLNINQPLSWDSRNQLQETIQVGRADTTSDKETYLYDGQGMRVQKTRIFLTESQIHTERVRYLNGLELREHWQTDELQGQNKQIREELHLIQASNGEVPVKVLHWESGKPDEIENDAIYYSLSDHLGSHQLELNNTGEIISFESYYPYGGTAIWSTKNQVESSYKYYRYSGKERDHSGLYYYGYRYYMPWLGRWLNPDPSGTDDGLNLFCMARNNPVTFYDIDGKAPIESNYQPDKEILVRGFITSLFGVPNLDLYENYRKYITRNPSSNMLTKTIGSETNENELRLFSQTGQLDVTHYEAIKNINPFYACFNCAITAYKTAYFLEYAKFPSLSIYESLPRPMRIEKLKAWPELFNELPENRGYLYLANLTRDVLESMMEKLGEGTHAIIGGEPATTIGKYFSGHFFNYALATTEKSKFTILDAYGQKYFELGLSDPDKYFSYYEPEIEALIFYKKSKKNEDFAKPYRRTTNF
jgi:insecticidal toxin complex protein TccC